MPTISITLENGFQGMVLQKWIIVPDTLPTPRTASWFAALSWAHVPGAIDLARLPRAVFPRGGGALDGGGGGRGSSAAGAAPSPEAPPPPPHAPTASATSEVSRKFLIGVLRRSRFTADPRSASAR